MHLFGLSLRILCHERLSIYYNHDHLILTLSLNVRGKRHSLKLISFYLYIHRFYTAIMGEKEAQRLGESQSKQG